MMVMVEEETYDSDVEFGAGDESDNEEIENMSDDDAVEEEGGVNMIMMI
ncbi:unnamed protein product [Brassica oleracea var. botrytis]|uniref:(rape) hypothetical protein n=1 Tax=Brassica napus TaxID=3708 RepID=A0A816KIX4_BRANA|nr:unnamed protein product [Brassica napus]